MSVSLSGFKCLEDTNHWVLANALSSVDAGYDVYCVTFKESRDLFPYLMRQFSFYMFR